MFCAFKGFCINNKILGEKNFDWTIMGGATILSRSLKTSGTKKVSAESDCISVS